MSEHAIYTGTLWHRRRRPVEHAFSYPLWLAWVDLSEPHGIVGGSGLWGSRWRPVTFNPRDLGPPGDGALEQRVRNRVAELGAHWSGRIFALCQLRTFGVLFNPLVLYWHFPDGASQPDQVLAEVSNTPWHERHWYLLAPAAPGERWTFEHDKDFHVSPFMPMEQRYRWTVSFHHGALSVRLANLDESGELFTAAMTLQRSACSPDLQRRLTWRGGWQSWGVLAGIYAHAFRLWRKGVPFHRHPDRSRSNLGG